VRALLGAERAGIPGYASALLWQDDLQKLAEEAARNVAHGFRRMKMRLGRGWDYDCAALAAVRKGAGAGIDIMCDGSMRYSVDAAEKLARHLQANDVFWFEEPFAPDDLDSFLELRPRVDMRIAAGENEFGFSGFRELLRAKAIDIAQADASRCGGLTEVLRVGRMCESLGTGLAPHSWSDAIAIVANAQAVAVCRNAITVEIDQTGNPFVDRLLVEPLTVKDGQLALSDRPGLGIDVDLAVVEELRIPAGQSVPPGNYSDMNFGVTAPAA
jgi:D-galactarolactone cycloisomerase